jgi:hypothetical protein
MGIKERALETAANAEKICAELEKEIQETPPLPAVEPEQVATPAPVIPLEAPVVPPASVPEPLNIPAPTFDSTWVPPVKAATLDGLGVQFDELAHKYFVLTGKYNAETKRFKEKIKTLEEDIQFQNEQITRYRNTANATPAATIPVQGDASDSGLTAEELEKFDGDTIGMVKKIGKAEAKKVESKIEAGLQRIEELEQRIQQESSNSFMSKVQTIHPDFMAIDDSDDFIYGFLKEQDGFSGRTYGESLRDAGSRGDVQRFCKIVQVYKDKRTPARIAVAPPTLANQIAPPKNPTVVTTARGEENLYFRGSEVYVY